MSGIFKAYDIRGIYPEQLNEEIAEKIGRAFVEFLGAKKIVIGRDMRPHSEPLFKALSKGIMEQGCDVIDLGLCSTPMTYHANGFLKADGSIMITASHNTKEWNGFKLCRKDDVPISGATGIADIQKLVEANNFKAAEKPGTLSHYNIADEYGKFLRGFARMDRKLKIVVDYANAMGSYEIAGIKDLFDIIPMYEELDGNFPNHEANPLHTETLDDIRAKVKETGAEFGAAFDGDADRCGFVDDEGNIIPFSTTSAAAGRSANASRNTADARSCPASDTPSSSSRCAKTTQSSPVSSPDTTTSRKTTLRSPRVSRSSNLQTSSARAEKRSASWSSR